MRSMNSSQAVRRSTEPLTDDDLTTAYANDVRDGRVIAGPKVRQACERHLRDLETGAARGLKWSWPHAKHAIAFFKFTRHSKGEWRGQIIELAAWQAFIIGSAFGWLRFDAASQRWLRRFKTIYTEVPKKNGKALALNTPIATPTGWTTIGELKAGYEIFDERGIVCRVTGVTQSMPERPCYELKFSDGEIIVADAEHEWLTKTLRHGNGRRGVKRTVRDNIRTTRQIAESVAGFKGQPCNHSIALAAELVLPDLPLPISPYVLGAWLGDGHSADARFTCADSDAEIVDYIRAEGVTARRTSLGREGSTGLYALGRIKDGNPVGLKAKLKDLGVLNRKHIPPAYLRASIAQRTSLLQGLMDTDGTISAAGQCVFTTTNERLRDGFVELARSLGFKPSTRAGRAVLNGRDVGEVYDIQFWAFLDRPVFRLKRKVARQRTSPRRLPRSTTRQIVSVTPVPSVPVRCIEVDSPSRLFLAGASMVPTHNSTLLGGVGLYGLVGDGEPGAEIYATATKREQARIVFGEARQMVLASPELRRIVRVLQNNLHVEQSYSKFEPLSSDANTGDGVNPHFGIVDELHRVKTRGLLAVIEQGMGARLQPMMWIITTAGDETPGTPYDDEHEYARKVLEGALDDDSYFAFIASPDDDDAWDLPSTWAKANPNYGISIKEHDLISAAAKARASAQALADFKRLRLNVRSSDADAAIKMETWRENTAGKPLDLEALRGRKCHVGIDLSSKTDITAVVLLFPPSETDAKWHIVPRFWVPESGVDERANRDRAPYKDWIARKFITATLGNVVDYRAVKDFVVETAKPMFRIVDVAFDPWNAGTLVNDLQDEGLTPFEFPQRTSHYAHPTKEFLGMLLDAEFEHYANPVLAWMASNFRLVRDHNENPMPSKKKSTARIDGIQAAIMALGRALTGDAGEALEDAILRRGGLA